MRFVLDASIGLAWFVDNPMDPYAGQVERTLRAGAVAIVPQLWPLEMANGFLTVLRRAALSREAFEGALRDVERLLISSIRLDPSTSGPRFAIEIGQQFQLTAYDAVYLELARREELPLATLDKGLRAAAAKAGVASLK
jgi:predicted nucleic acid-binding protein